MDSRTDENFISDSDFGCVQNHQIIIYVNSVAEMSVQPIIQKDWIRHCPAVGQGLSFWFSNFGKQLA